MSDQIATLTEQAIDAFSAGDKDSAAALFAERDGIANEMFPGDGAQAKPSGYEGPRLDSDSVSVIVENLSFTPEGRATIELAGGVDGAEFAGRAYAAHSYAVEFERQHPELAAAIETAVIQDPTLFLSVFRAAADRGRSTESKPRETKVTEQRTPSPKEHESLQDQIDAILAENPVGSDTYKSNKVQRRLQELYKAQGDEPIVGREMRTI